MKEKLLFFIAISGVFGVLAVLQFSFLIVAAIIIFAVTLLLRFSLVYNFIFLITFLIFLFSTYFHFQSNTSQLTEDTPQLKVVFRNPASIDGDALNGFVYDEVSGEKLWLQYRFTSEEEKRLFVGNLTTGASFVVTGCVEKPTNATVENSFDFGQYLRQKKCHWIFKASSMQYIGTASSWWMKILQLRERGMGLIGQHFPEPLQSHALALIFGEQRFIAEGNYQAYQKLGVAHLLAISGTHVGVLVMLIYQLLIRIGVTRETTMMSIVVLLPFYACMTGFSPSVNRAAGMAMFYFIGRLLNARITGASSISICLLGYLLIDPYQLFTAGFQLSFSISFGLIASRGILERYQLGKVATSFVVTLLCQVFSVPILAYFFYEISLIGFLVNVIYIPVFTLIYFPLTVVSYLLLLGFPGYVGELISGLNYLFEGLVLISNQLADVPFASLVVGKPSALILFLFLLLIVLSLVLIDIGKIRWSVVASSLLVFVFIFQAFQASFSAQGEVTFVDVGQGDAIFIQLPYNRGNYLIDAGGVFNFGQQEWAIRKKQFDPGKDILTPFLKSKGIRKLDKLILTHADQDHIGGAEAIIANFQVEQLLVPIGSEEAFGKRDWFLLLQQKGKVQFVATGDHWQARHAQFEVVNPSVVSDDANRASIVLLATINSVKWLFTGDVDVEGEAEILSLYPDLKANVLKLGHHGSKTSTSEDLLDSLEPNIAVITVGRNNRYGHPNRGVLDKLEERQIPVLRTDLDGSIKYSFSERRQGRVDTFPP